MASNPFDQFDSANPFDQFDTPRAKQMENGMPVFPDMPGAGRAYSPAPSSSFLDYFKSVDAAAGRSNEAVSRRPGSAPIGTMEAVGSLASGAVATPIGSLVGMGTEAARGLGLTNAKGEDVAERVQNFLTYRPQSESGKAKVGLVGAASRPLTESGADIALLPLAAESAALRAAPKEKPLPIPSTDELRAAKNAAYKAGNAADVLTSPEQNAAAISKIDEALKAENLVVDPDLHPKATALLKRLQAQKDQPLTVPEAESLRQLALEVQRDVDPLTKQPTADAYRAGVILDELDNSLETLSVNKPARELNARFRRSQMLDEMIRRAEIKAGANYTQAGMEHALRNEFKQLALNPRRMRGLTMEQKAAVEKVAKGGAVENSLRALGKFDPTTGGMAAFIGTGTGGALGGAIGGVAGGGVGALALPALGFLSKRGATRMTGRNVDLAREALVGRNPAMIPPVPQAAPAAMTGELMQRPPLALPAPNIIAGSRSAPGTAYAREQMGLTPDVEAAGMFHPGMARESVPLPPLGLPYRPAQPVPDYVVDAAGNTAAPGGFAASGLTPDVVAATLQHPGRARSTPPQKPLALPLLPDKPMIVDSQGRVAATQAQIDEYLRDMGLDRMRNVRQPRAEPIPGLLAAEPEPQGLLGRPTRSADQVRAELQKLDAKLRKLPAGEPLDSPRRRALAQDMERLRAELSRAESQGASP